jgi:GNAT superfamily N-acetyltransferase
VSESHPALVIRAVDPHDDADMTAFQDVYAAAERAEDPTTPLYSREDAVSMLTSTSAGYFWDGFGAFHDGRMVGESMISGGLRDTLGTARVFVWVSPDAARRGIGTRLAWHAEDQLRRRGRRVAQGQARIGVDRANGNRRFAERMGYVLANTEVERRLPLPADPGLLDRLAAEAEPHHRDYTVRVEIGPVPDELAPSYAALKNLINTEMPSGDLEVEVGRDTVDEVRTQDRELTAAGRRRVTAYALDGDGQVVGYAVAAVSNAGFDHVDQWGTLVHPAHRGHRLGMAVKCAQVRAISTAFPDKRLITTTNAETNAPMVAINEALGFEVHEVYGDFQKRL